MKGTFVNHSGQWIEGAMNTMKTGMDELDIELLVRYVVREEEYKEALAVVERFGQHPAAANVIRNYYAELPEGLEEMACDLRVVVQRCGAFIFALKTTDHCYLYFGSEDAVQFIGTYRQGLADDELLSFFGFPDSKTFGKHVEVAFETLARPAKHVSAASCIVCGVAIGEAHVLGCPVEQCPWCQGQLNRCNCRFDQLGVEEFTDEAQLERFEEILETKGRIAFAPEQAPAYPIAGNDPGPAGRSR